MHRLRGLSHRERLLLAVAITVPLLAIATGAQASSGGALRLLGGRSGAAGRSCGVAPSWIYYSVGGTVRYAGHVPSRVTRIKLVVWRCYPSGFSVVETLHAHVSSTGSFMGSFVVNVHSDCYAQATYVGGHSNRAYFRVR
jgi:hypothetical protein